MESGFKIVHFDAMYNVEGLMPWIMEGIHIPSVGIVGRWRDRTEARGQGVEGPYVLWRDRVADLRDQLATQAEDTRQRELGNIAEEVCVPRMCATRHIKRMNGDIAYVIIEELARQSVVAARIND